MTVQHARRALGLFTLSFAVLSFAALGFGCTWSSSPTRKPEAASKPAPPKQPPAGSRPAAPDPDPFVEVSAGNQHSCALQKSGGVMCWGNNTYGQLGNDTRSDSRTMVAVRGLSDAVEIEAGGDFSCARRRSGSVVCWGNNQLGQLGDGRGVKVGAWSTRPTAVQGLSDAVDVGAGEMFACALRRGGTVVCWGEASSGQIDSSGERGFARPKPIAGIAGAISLAVGGQHVCAALRSGQVKCWGRNTEGQLGDGKNASRSNARAVLGISDAKSLIGGGRHTCALRSRGKVSCWGDNRQGQLGLGSGLAPQRTPKDVKGLIGMKRFVTGDQHSCALFSESDLRCWGDNAEGQIDRTKRPRPAPFKVPGVRGVVDVATGHRHTCVVSRGKVFCWGSNERNALGPNPLR